MIFFIFVLSYFTRHVIDFEFLLKSTQPIGPYCAYLASMCRPIPLLENMMLILNFIFSQVHKTLLWCEQILQQDLLVAKTSLLRAARDNPMFGCLACIRHLLSKLDFKEIAKCSYWAKFITKLVLICRELTQVVSIVVNSSSPEGHLPNDFSAIETYGFDEDVEMQSIDPPDDEEITDECELDSKPTPQMVLLCSWRTVKEVSLILGDIAFRSPIVKNQHSIIADTPVDCSGLMSCDRIIEIGSHFTQLLSETKHRGAFEQAYVGFSKLCIRLWGSQHSELHQLPMKWLQEMINVINSEGTADNGETNLNADKICSTRRSAGIPYMMQALITSELQVSSSKGLQFSVRKLIELCRGGSTAQTRTHSLNILRALFRSTDLGEAIGEFVSDGIECAINGYDAECWSVSSPVDFVVSTTNTSVINLVRCA